jgi:dihydroorotase
VSVVGPEVILRGVRLIDPIAGIDAHPRSLLIRNGRIEAIERRVDVNGVTVVDLTPPDKQSWIVVSPAFIDLHTHLREPGEEAKETVATGARAAAAGGFGQILAMANTKPPIDTPAEVGRARGRTAGAAVRVLAAAAVTRGLGGEKLTDLSGCAAAGCAAFTDDGRNAMPPRLLALAIREAEDVGRAVLIHPEDEAMIAAANPGASDVARCSLRPAACEVAAVENALRALVVAGRGHLHLQHVSAAGAVETLRAAREEDLAVSAEVTPHHLAMWRPLADEPDPAALAKVNPPLRGERDRAAVIQALREGVIDCIATDHAPHTAADKSGPYADAAPGMVGLETALAVCLTLGGMGGDWLPVLVERLTAGPWNALGPEVGLAEPRLRTGRRATLTVFDPRAEWVVGEEPMRSLSRNTPLLGTRLRGRVLLTLVDGTVAHVGDDERMRAVYPEAASVG